MASSPPPPFYPRHSSRPSSLHRSRSSSVESRPRGRSRHTHHRNSSQDSLYLSMDGSRGPIQRWDGLAREATDWNSLRRDPELYLPAGNCMVFLYAAGSSQRGPSFRIPYDVLLYSGCRPLIDRCLMGTSTSEYHPASSTPPSYDTMDYQSEENCSFLYLPAPAGLSGDEIYVYHITTRNFFAWLLGVPLVGTDPVTALLDLKMRMDVWRDQGSGNFGALFDYVKEQGYGDFEALEVEMGKRLNVDVHDANGTLGFPPTNPIVFNDQSTPKDEGKTSRRNSLTQRIRRRFSRSRGREEERAGSIEPRQTDVEARLQTFRMNSYTHEPPLASAEHISASMQRLAGPPSTPSVNVILNAQSERKEKITKRRSWTNIVGNAWKHKSMTDISLPPLQTQQPQPVGLSPFEGPYSLLYAHQPPSEPTFAVVEKKKKRRLLWKRTSMTDIILSSPQTQQPQPITSSPPSAPEPTSTQSLDSPLASAPTPTEKKWKRRFSWKRTSMTDVTQSSPQTQQPQPIMSSASNRPPPAPEPTSTQSLNSSLTSAPAPAEEKRKRRLSWKRTSVTDITLSSPETQQTQQPQPITSSASNEPLSTPEPTSTLLLDSPLSSASAAAEEKRKRRFSWKRTSMTDITLSSPQTQQPQPITSSASNGPPPTSEPTSTQSLGSPLASVPAPAEEKRKRRLSWKRTSMTDITLSSSQAQQPQPITSSASNGPLSNPEPTSTQSLDSPLASASAAAEEKRKRRLSWKYTSITDITLSSPQTQQPQPITSSASNEPPSTPEPTSTQSPDLPLTSAPAPAEEKRKRRFSWKRTSVTDITLSSPQTQQPQPIISSASNGSPSAPEPTSTQSLDSPLASVPAPAEEKRKRRLSWANVSDKIFDIMMPPISKDDLPPPAAESQEAVSATASKPSGLPATEVAPITSYSPAAIAVPTTEVKPTSAPAAAGSATRPSSHHPSIHDFSTGQEICACCGKVRQRRPESGAGPSRTAMTDVKDGKEAGTSVPTLTNANAKDAFENLHDHMKARRKTFKSKSHKEIIIPGYGNGTRGQTTDARNRPTTSIDVAVPTVQVRTTDAGKIKTPRGAGHLSKTLEWARNARKAKTRSIDAIVSPVELRTTDLKKISAQPADGAVSSVKVRPETSVLVPATPMSTPDLVASPVSIAELTTTPSTPDSLSLREYRRSARPASLDYGGRSSASPTGDLPSTDSGRSGDNSIPDIHYSVTTARESAPASGNASARPGLETLGQTRGVEQDKFRVVDADFESNIEDLLAQLEAAGISEPATNEGKNNEKSLVDLESSMGMSRMAYKVA